jgi:hypothetical protein
MREGKGSEVNLVGVTERLIKGKEECFAMLKRGMQTHHIEIFGIIVFS